MHPIQPKTERTALDERRPNPRKEITKRSYQDDKLKLCMHPVQLEHAERTAVDDRRPDQRKEKTKKVSPG